MLNALGYISTWHPALIAFSQSKLSDSATQTVSGVDHSKLRKPDVVTDPQPDARKLYSYVRRALLSMDCLDD